VLFSMTLCIFCLNLINNIEEIPFKYSKIERKRSLIIYHCYSNFRTCLLAMASGSLIRASGFQNPLVRIGKWIFFSGK
jgi:hypothetical protein